MCEKEKDECHVTDDLFCLVVVHLDHIVTKRPQSFPMLPMCQSQPMLVPAVPPMMVPMVPVQPAAMLYPPNYANMCMTTITSNEDDSRRYGRFRHVEREVPSYRHAPFDWYRPPQQRYDIVHEDAAVVTLDGPMPMGDFYRYYIYGEGVDEYDDDDGASSYESDVYEEIPSYSGGRRSRSSFNYGEEASSRPLFNQWSNSTSGYSTLDPTRRSSIPTPAASRPSRFAARDDDFDDSASVNSTYDR
jgi:hypothetical protein